jgi:hypothetical protein
VKNIPLAAGLATVRSSAATWRRATVRSRCPKPGITARTVAGFRSPDRPKQRLRHQRDSLRTVACLVSATVVASFDETHRLIGQLTGIEITAPHLQDLTHEIGEGLAAARDERTRAYRARPLNSLPRAARPPMAVAVVTIDPAGCRPGSRIAPATCTRRTGARPSRPCYCG